MMNRIGKTVQIYDSSWLDICVIEPTSSEPSVSIENLYESLGSLHHLVCLLAAAFSNDRRLPLAKRSDIHHEFDESYVLTCQQTKPGSYVVPVNLDFVQAEDEFVQLDDSNRKELDKFKHFFEESITLIAKDNHKELKQRFPNESNARRVVSAVKGLSPSNGTELVLRKNRTKKESIFDSERDREKIAAIDRRLRQEAKQSTKQKTLTVIAKVDAVDLTNRTFRSSTQEGIVVTSNLDMGYINAKELFDPKYIEVDGNFEVNQNEELLDIKEISQERFINLDPIEVSEFQINNEHLKVDPPLVYQVEFEKEDMCYSLDGELDMSLYAYSREDLESMLYEVLEFWWREVALAEDSELEPIAIKKKHVMLNRIKRV